MKFLILIFLSLFFLKTYSSPLMGQKKISFNFKSTGFSKSLDLSYKFSEKLNFSLSSDYYESLLFSYPFKGPLVNALYGDFFIDKIEDYRDYALGINFLSYKIQKNYQMHLHLKAQLGFYTANYKESEWLKDQKDLEKLALLTKISVLSDWTYNDYYAQAQLKYYRSLKDKSIDFFDSFFRLGVSPYKTNQFKSWFILQAQVYLKNKDYIDEKGESIAKDSSDDNPLKDFNAMMDTHDYSSHFSKNIQLILSPLIRLSYPNFLLELGSSLKKDYYFTRFSFYY